MKVLGKVKEKKIRLKPVTAKEYIAEPRIQKMLGSHGPGEVPKQWATSFDAVRKGEYAVASVELGRLLGREPEGFEETVRRMVNRLIACLLCYSSDEARLKHAVSSARQLSNEVPYFD